MAVMGQPVQQRRRHLCIPKHTGPLREAQVGGDRHALMAMSNSPTRGHPKFPQAGRPDYDDTGVIAMRAAASLSR